MQQNLILVINCGSSSLKFALFSNNKQPNNTQQNRAIYQQKLLAEGLAESLNQESAKLKFKINNEKFTSSLCLSEVDSLSEVNSGPHSLVIEEILKHLERNFQLSQALIGIGHRVVHGGDLFKQSIKINPQVIKQIKACVPLAPLHNPANIMGIEVMARHFPNTPQVAVFDTAFHQTMPDRAFTYALPYSLYSREGIRRYGFHGTSHNFIARQAALYFEKDISALNLVTAHLGNGASVASIAKGKSVDTSMGMTPLEGLVMGTRSGDIDPGIFDFLLSKGYHVEQISTLLNQQSGLLGISGLSNDMRTICEHAEQGHERSRLALEIFCFRLAKYIAAMMVSLDKLDALIFTGGIGENSALVREKTITLLGIFGFKLDKTLNHNLRPENENTGIAISELNTRPILVIPTNEELMIVQDTLELIQ